MASTPTNDTPKDAPKKRGAQPGNKNAIRHGLNAGKLPKRLQYVERKVNEFRRNLEDLVMAAKKEINIVDAATISSCIKWERHARLAEYWLRNEIDELSPSDRLKFSAEIAKASDQRDKNIRLLGLDRDANVNVIDALYRNNKVTDSDDERNT